jgi:hypothetical protein
MRKYLVSSTGEGCVCGAHGTSPQDDSLFFVAIRDVRCFTERFEEISEGGAGGTGDGDGMT